MRGALGQGRVHGAARLVGAKGPKRRNSGDVRQDDRVHRDASRSFDASSRDAVFPDAAPVKIHAGKI